MTNTKEPTKRIIKIHQCPTLSNNSTLTYHIGCDEKEAIYFQIKTNTGGGFFNNEWIALADIQQAFDKWPVDNPITSFAINDLFTGKSANSPAFLMAILKEEGIVATLKGKHRSHEYIEPVEFMVEMDKLIQSGVSLEAEKDKPKKSNASTTKRSTCSSKSQLKSA